MAKYMSSNLKYKPDCTHNTYTVSDTVKRLGYKKGKDFKEAQYNELGRWLKVLIRKS